MQISCPGKCGQLIRPATFATSTAASAAYAAAAATAAAATAATSTEAATAYSAATTVATSTAVVTAYILQQQLEQQLQQQLLQQQPVYQQQLRSNVNYNGISRTRQKQQVSAASAIVRICRLLRSSLAAQRRHVLFA